jgi:hypothetical protein
MFMPAIKETVRVAAGATDEWRSDRRDLLKALAASLFGLMMDGRGLLAAGKPGRAGFRFGRLTCRASAGIPPRR